MKLIIIVIVMLVSVSPLMAEIYSWTDENGTVNFTEDYSKIPKKYRKKVHIRGSGDEMAAPPTQSPPVSAEKRNMVAPSAEQGAHKGGAPEKNYGGKSLDDWKKELMSAEAEVKELDARVKALAVAVKNSGEYFVSRSQVEVRQQYDEAVDAFNKSSARYDAMVKAAISAGVPIEPAHTGGVR